MFGEEVELDVFVLRNCLTHCNQVSSVIRQTGYDSFVLVITNESQSLLLDVYFVQLDE